MTHTNIRSALETCLSKPPLSTHREETTGAKKVTNVVKRVFAQIREWIAATFRAICNFFSQKKVTVADTPKLAKSESKPNQQRVLFLSSIAEAAQNRLNRISSKPN